METARIAGASVNSTLGQLARVTGKHVVFTARRIAPAHAAKHDAEIALERNRREGRRNGR